MSGYGKSNNQRSVGNYKTLTFIGPEWSRIVSQFKEFPDEAMKCLVWMKDAVIDGSQVIFNHAGCKSYTEMNFGDQIRAAIPNANFKLDTRMHGNFRYYDNNLDQNVSPGLKISINGIDLKDAMNGA